MKSNQNSEPNSIIFKTILKITEQQLTQMKEELRRGEKTTFNKFVNENYPILRNYLKKKFFSFSKDDDYFIDDVICKDEKGYDIGVICRTFQKIHDLLLQEDKGIKDTGHLQSTMFLITTRLIIDYLRSIGIIGRKEKASKKLKIKLVGSEEKTTFELEDELYAKEIEQLTKEQLSKKFKLISFDPNDPTFLQVKEDEFDKEMEDILKQLWQFIKKYYPELYDVGILRHKEGYKIREIAAMLNVDQRTIYNKLAELKPVVTTWLKNNI